MTRDTPNDYSLTINPRVYCGTLLVILVGFIVIHCGLSTYSIEVEEVPWLLLQLFHLDEENNLSTWFSSFLLLNDAFVLYLISNAKAHKYRNYWFALAVGFFILAIDEVAGLHETVNTAIEMSWVIPGGILVIVAALALVPFLLSLDRKLAFLFVASGLTFVSGAIGVEFLSEDMDEDSLAYAFAVALEEGMEMFGAWMFLAVNLNHIAGNGKQRIEVAVSIKGSSDPSAV